MSHIRVIIIHQSNLRGAEFYQSIWTASVILASILSEPPQMGRKDHFSCLLWHLGLTGASLDFVVAMATTDTTASLRR